MNIKEMHEVLPHLYIGGLQQTEPKNLDQYQIKTVLTVMDVNIAEFPRSKDVKYHWIRKFDMPSEKILNSFPEYVKIISEGLERGNMLVHCQCGISRSVSAVISYMIAVLNFTRDESLKIIREKRPWAHPNSGFMEQLDIFEKEVRPHWTEESAGRPYRRHIEQIKERITAKKASFFAADAALQKRVEDRKRRIEGDGPELQQPAPTSSSFILKCRQCRKVLCSREDLEPHSRALAPVFNGKDCPSATSCTSYFISPELPWLPQGDVQGKLKCTCNAKLGSFTWVSTQCSCGAWVTPAFQIHKARVDRAVLINEPAAAVSTPGLVTPALAVDEEYVLSEELQTSCGMKIIV